MHATFQESGCKISRNNLSLLFLKVPDASPPPPRPIPIPQELAELLVAAKPDCSTGGTCSGAVCSRFSPSHPQGLPSRGKPLSTVLLIGGPFPMSEGGLSAFMAVLFSQGLAAATIQSYLAAVRHAQIASITRGS